MNRLEAINKELSIKINRLIDEGVLNRICLTTCNFAIKQGNLSNDKIIEEVILKLESNTNISDVDIQNISSLMEKHDEMYFDYDDEGKAEEAMMEFEKARASSSIWFGLQFNINSDSELLQESIYEASMLNEDTSELFNSIESLLE